MEFEQLNRAQVLGDLQTDALHSVVDTERELAEARRCFASLLDSLSGIFYRCALRSPWRMSFISDGVEHLTGYSRKDLERKAGWSDIMDPADRAAVELAVCEAIAERQSFDATYRIKRKDGAIRWVAERGHAVCDSSGSPMFLEGIISDVSGCKQADELQRTMVSKWRKTLDTIPQMVWTMSADGEDEFYNRRWFEFTGVTVGRPKGVDRMEFVHPDDRQEAANSWNESFTSGNNYEAQYRLRHVSGEHRWVLSRGCLERDGADQALRWYGTWTDVHDQVVAREALQASEGINRSIVAASPDCICLLDPAGKLVFMNKAAQEVVGLESCGALIGAHWGDMFLPSVRGRPAHLAVDQARRGRTAHFSASRPLNDTMKWWDVIVVPIKTEEGLVSGIITIARDMTHQKTAEEQVRWAANHDALTLLPNRTLFQEALDEALVKARETGGNLSVLMMDLDDFKRTNDALGHDAGDALLAEFSNRLRAAVRTDDVVARLGGDEFAVLLRGVGRKEQVEAAVASILRSLEVPFTFDGTLLDIRSTIGASTFPFHGSARIDLLKHADMALYVAKATNRGGLKVFRSDMRAEVHRRMSMLSLATQALREDRIVPFYQAKFNLRTGQLEGFEALLRLKHANQRIQPPATIEAAFKDINLAAEISDKIIDCVISDICKWKEDGVAFGHIAVNAGAAELRKGDFADKLLERLHRAALPSSSIQVEVTEMVFLGRGAERVEKTLQTLARQGIQIALDDFGTGYASLSHLNQFPVDVLKIDRSFISKLEHSSHDAAIVRAVINLGRSLGIKIVAEGVENADQVAFLTRHRCDYGQGYLFARAQRASKVAWLVSEWSGGHPTLAKDAADRRLARKAA